MPVVPITDVPADPNRSLVRVPLVAGRQEIPMPMIAFVQPDGSRREVQAPAGTSVMKNAVLNDVAGIVAECGGSLMCATCHVYVDPADAARLPALGDDEDEMLEVAAAERRETSRLSCQLTVDETLDGLTVHVPEAQA